MAKKITYVKVATLLKGAAEMVGITVPEGADSVDVYVKRTEV